MPILIYEGAQPSPEQFQADLEQALAITNPIDDLLALAAELHKFEQKYQMSSADFYQQYQAGLLNDELQHCLTWAAIYKMLIKTKRRLENALMRAAVQSEVEKVIA